MKIGTKARPLHEHYDIRDCVAIDGDTIQARILLGFDVSLIRRIRLKGFYAFELDGQCPGQGIAAKVQLQAFLDRSELSIQGRGSRLDNHGRLVAILFHEGQAVNPFDVLGPYQISEQDHREDLNFVKRNRTGKRGVF